MKKDRQTVEILQRPLLSLFFSEMWDLGSCFFFLKKSCSNNITYYSPAITVAQTHCFLLLYITVSLNKRTKEDHQINKLHLFKNTGNCPGAGLFNVSFSTWDWKHGHGPSDSPVPDECPNRRF